MFCCLLLCFVVGDIAGLGYLFVFIGCAHFFDDATCIAIRLQYRNAISDSMLLLSKLQYLMKLCRKCFLWDVSLNVWSLHHFLASAKESILMYEIKSARLGIFLRCLIVGS